MGSGGWAAAHIRSVCTAACLGCSEERLPVGEVTAESRLAVRPDRDELDAGVPPRKVATDSRCVASSGLL